MASFVLKFSHFRCHGNRGRSDINFNDTGKLPDLENPRLVQHLGCSRSRAERFRAAQFRAAQFRAARFSAAAALKRAVLSNTGDRQAMVAAFTFEIGSLSNVLRISVGDKHVTEVERYSFFVLSFCI